MRQHEESMSYREKNNWAENGAVALAQRLGSPCEKGEQQAQGDGEMIKGGVSLQAGDALMDLT